MAYWPAANIGTIPAFSDVSRNKVSIMPKLDDESGLRLAFAVAAKAHANGNHPFGCVLVGPDGKVLLEAENGYMPDRDMTAHAERLLATAASRKFRPAELARCTMYTSAEPCAMCAGAAYWPRGEPDARPALPHRVFGRPAADRGGRPAARGRGGGAARGCLGLSENLR
jgi:hypothetical protein